MEHVWTLEIPQSLRRPGVRERYEQATFVRETALSDHERPPTIDYLALGHPLLDALIASVKSDARESGMIAGRMSVRILPDVPRGLLFTYLGRWQDRRGSVVAEAIVPVFLGLDGKPLAHAEAVALLATSGLRRNAPASLLSEVYEPVWETRREEAHALAIQRCAELAAQVKAERMPQLELLRRDIEGWAEARIRWVERQLARRAEQEELQLPLFDTERVRALAAAETRRKNDLKREGEVIANRRQQREAEIAAMEQVVPVAPELIGALVIVPAEDC